MSDILYRRRGRAMSGVNGSFFPAVPKSLASAVLVGAMALLIGEAAGFATDFTFSNPGQRVAIIANDGTKTWHDVNSFYSNGGTSPKLVYDATGALVWSPHNMVLQSENLTTSWTVGGTPNVTATTVEDATAAQTSTVSQSVTTVVGATYTHVWWVLADSETTRFPEFRITSTNACGISLDTQTGATAEITNTLGASISCVADGAYWKLAVTFTAGAASSTIRIAPAYSATLGAANSAVPVGIITVQKQQFNRGHVPTAYLATTTAARYGLAIDHDPTTLACKGLLVEPAATNLALQGRDFSSSSWTKTSMTAARTATGPDGMANGASTLTATAANALALQAITSASAARVTSTFVKRRTGTGSVLLSQGETTGSDLITNGGFDTDTVWVKGTDWTISGGVATKVGGTSAALTNAVALTPGKIYRIVYTVSGYSAGSLTPRLTGGSSFSGPPASANGTFTAYLVAGPTSANAGFLASGSFAGNVDDVSLYEVVATDLTVPATWGRVSIPAATLANPSVMICFATSGDAIDVDFFQHETGSVETSPVPTFATTVTRAADRPNFLTSQIPYSTTEGTVIIRVTNRNISPTMNFWTISDETNNNRITGYQNAGGSCRLFIADGGVSQADLASGTIIANQEFISGGVWAVNDVAHSKDGAIVSVDAAATIPATVTTFRLGTSVAGTTGFMLGHIESIVYLPRRMANADLQLRTAA